MRKASKLMKLATGVDFNLVSSATTPLLITASCVAAPHTKVTIKRSQLATDAKVKAVAIAMLKLINQLIASPPTSKHEHPAMADIKEVADIIHARAGKWGMSDSSFVAEVDNFLTRKPYAASTHRPAS